MASHLLRTCCPSVAATSGSCSSLRLKPAAVAVPLNHGRGYVQYRSLSSLSGAPVSHSIARPSSSIPPPPSGIPPAPAARYFQFRLERLSPQLRSEFDEIDNQRALRHLRSATPPKQPDTRPVAPQELVVEPTSVHPVLWRCRQCNGQWSARPSDRSDPQVSDAYRCPQCYGSTIPNPQSRVSCHAQRRSVSSPILPDGATTPTDGESAPTSSLEDGGGGGDVLLCEAYPQLAAQWDPQRNHELNNRVLQTLTSVRTRSSAKVWWRCPLCCAAWLETVASRVTRFVISTERYRSRQSPPSSSGSTAKGVSGESTTASGAPIPLCPSCERRGAALGGGHPQRPSAVDAPRRWLADDILLLGEVLLRPHQNPREISLSSETMLQWRCRTCQFEYGATVANRFLRHERCPQCAGSVKTPLNLLAIQRPDVVAEVSKHISRTRLRHITVHGDEELPFVCRTCYAPYRMTARARCAVPKGVPACPKCFLSSTQLLSEVQHKQRGEHQLRRRWRRRALQASRSSRHGDRLRVTATELNHRDGALKD